MERVPDLDVEVLGLILGYTAISLFVGHLTSTGLFPVACSTFRCHLVENLGPYVYHQVKHLGLFGLVLFMGTGFWFLVLWLCRPKPSLQPHDALLAENIARARLHYAPLRRRLREGTDLSLVPMSRETVVMPENIVRLGTAARARLYSEASPERSEPANQPPPYQAPSPMAAPPPPPYQPPVVAAATDKVAQWAKEAKEAEEKNYQQEALRICQVYFDRKKEPNYNGTKYIPVREKFNSALVAQLADAMLLPHRFSAVAEGRAVYISESALDIIHAVSNQKTHPGDD